MKITNFVLLVITFLTSCSTNKNESAYSSNIEFPEIEHVNCTKLNDSHLFAHPKQIAVIDSLIIVADNAHGKLLHIFNTKGDFIKSFANVGKGPGEAINVNYFSIANNGDVVIYDPQSMKIIRYNLQAVRSGDIKNSFQEQNIASRITKNQDMQVRIWDAISMTDSTYLLVGNNDKVRFGIMSNDIVSTYNQYPECVDTQNIEEVWSIFANETRCKLNAAKNKMVQSTFIGGILQFFEISNNNIHNYKTMYIFEPKYDIAEGAKPTWVTSNNETQPGFIDIDVDDNYVYSLLHQFSDDIETRWEYPNAISVFDWEGNPIKKIISDRQLVNISIDKDEIYGICLDKVKEEYVMVKCNLLLSGKTF